MLTDQQWAEARASAGWARDMAAHSKAANPRYRAMQRKINARRDALEEKHRVEMEKFREWEAAQRDAYSTWRINDERNRVEKRLARMFGDDV